MKKVLLSLFVIFLSFNVFSQDTLIQYFDKQNKKVKKKAKTDYYKKIVQKSDSIWYMEKYNAGDTILYSATYKTKNFETKNGYYKKYFSNGTIQNEGNYINNEKTGDWIYYHENGKIEKKGIFEKGKWKDVPLCYNENGNEIDGVFYPIELTTKPEFPGGDNEMLKFISRTVKYPENSKEQCISGTVYISFIIDKKGKLSEEKIIRSVSSDIDEECLRVVSLFPDFKPGKINETPVKVFYVVPIKFMLH